MPISRVYQNVALKVGAILDLDEPASHHIARVLRAEIGETLIIFNGQGGEYTTIISKIDKKKVTVDVQAFSPREAESPIILCLAQGISRGEKMDYTIQKAVELGVNQIIPLQTERCNVKLTSERKEKRLQHWKSIIVSACEQSGRNQIPELLDSQTLSQWLPNAKADCSFVLVPNASQKLEHISLPPGARVTLLIGPEGGLSEIEITHAVQHGFLPLNLGPRILRTETAAVAAITAIQCHFGDMGR